MRLRRLGIAAIGLILSALAMPVAVAAHQLSASFESRLPLAVYLVGAAGAVALSFVFVLVRDLRSDPVTDDGRRVTMPALVRG
ncbi:MAG: hypothetical protein ABIZ30_10805, partial [Candidatus Limnocylindrales bacterium]